MSRIPVPPERRDSLTPGSPPIPPTPSKRSHRPTSPIGKSGRKPTLPPPPQSCPISSQYKSQKAAQLPRYVPSYIKVSPSPQISKMEEYSITDSFRFVFTSPGMWKDAFKTLYQFYESGQLCDVEVTVGERTFRCHRAVLACASRYFRAMFTGEMAESRQSSVTIQDANVDAESLELLIKYAYLAQVELTVDNVQPLLYAASILQVEPVADACCAFMRKHLHPFNCIAVRNFAEQHGRKELIEIVDDFISEKFVEVSETADFLDLSAATLEQLLQRTDLNVETEAQVYEAVVLWVRHDVEGRGEALAGLMAHVKLPLLSPTFLLQHVETEELMRTNLLCRDFLDEAKYYQMSLVSLVPEVKVTDRIRPRKSYAGVLFCVGGRGVSGDPFRSIECYDVRRDSWFAVSEMSSRRRHVGVCSAGGLVYAVGGHDGSDHLASGEMFDPEINKWKEICPMSTPRRGIALACLGGPIYAVGGLDDNQCYSVVERYDPVSDTWTFVSNTNIPRGGVGVAALKGRLYAVGGNDGATSLDSCETYDPFLNKWTVVSSMSTRRAGAGVAVLNGCLYVVGGFDDNFPLDTAEKYDPKSDTWSTIGRMSHSRGGVGVASLGGLLYAVGGHNGRNYLNSVEAYDPVEDRWLTVADTSEWRAGAGVVFSDTAVRLVQQAAGQRIVSAV